MVMVWSPSHDHWAKRVYVILSKKNLIINNLKIFNTKYNINTHKMNYKIVLIAIISVLSIGLLIGFIVIILFDGSKQNTEKNISNGKEENSDKENVDKKLPLENNEEQIDNKKNENPTPGDNQQQITFEDDDQEWNSLEESTSKSQLRRSRTSLFDSYIFQQKDNIPDNTPELDKGTPTQGNSVQEALDTFEFLENPSAES
ncbi:hypothetical protein SLOPH_2322 [Spraguea lophii 42_110]|uniref:Uncharacterized protein n=1 Tax=Spraguea lophii (strain 42_110) TaxID=1358809 RepID=S7W872_SPRLO|nr:hypothetical protein SLOPH_2322 [Spraguea lophii 42_110]